MLKKQPDYLLVPIPMCIWVAQNNLEKPFKSFLHLKMQYRHGKTKLSVRELQGMSMFMEYADTRTLKKHLDKMYQLGWVKYNKATGHYILNSFETIRKQYDWEQRACIECTAIIIDSIHALVGAAIYAYQHKDFWRKVKRERIVRLMGRTYNFLSASFNYKEHFAPVATTGIELLYGISKTKASMLKREAEKSGFIQVKKDYKELNYTESDINLMIKYGDLPPYVKKYKGRFLLQLIDLILPNIPIRRRQKLIT